MFLHIDRGVEDKNHSFYGPLSVPPILGLQRYRQLVQVTDNRTLGLELGEVVVVGIEGLDDEGPGVDRILGPGLAFEDLGDEGPVVDRNLDEGVVYIEHQLYS